MLRIKRFINAINLIAERKIEICKDRIRKKHSRKRFDVKKLAKLRTSNSWIISNWHRSLAREAKSSNDVTVTIESPTELETDSINSNNDGDDDDDGDNWSDITVD